MKEIIRDSLHFLETREVLLLEKLEDLLFEETDAAQKAYLATILLWIVKDETKEDWNRHHTTDETYTDFMVRKFRELDELFPKEH